MRSKLQRFAELLAFPNVYENPHSAEPQLIGLHGEIVEMKGKWHSEHFKNDKPITLELACGRGEYAVALGRMFPERNFIGVDIKGARLHQGATAALNEGLGNVAFLRTRIEQIALFFAENEVAEIWITFPDPFLRESKSNRRLTSSQFLERYKSFLQKDGLIHLKTDSPVLYDFTLDTLAHTEEAEVLFADDDIYANRSLADVMTGKNELAVTTYYEKKNIANSTIKYIRFKI